MNLSTNPNKIKVVLCIPGNSYSNKFLISWTNLIVGMIQSNKYDFYLSNNYSSQVNFARAMCLGANVLRGPAQKPFQGTLDYDVILWLDSDMVYTYDIVDELIQSCYHKYPVVSGIYALDGGRDLCCVKEWDEKYHATHGTFQFLSAEEGNRLIQEKKEWVKCSYVGMGCMAIRKGVIERLSYPWFFRNIAVIKTDRPDMPALMDGTSEDVSFIRNMIDNGIIDGVMVNLKLRFGHEKTVVY